MLNPIMKTSSEITVIIAAGGTGTRFGKNIPKQFAMEGKRPVLWHTLKAIHQSCPGAAIIVPMHSDSISMWYQMLGKFSDTPFHIVLEGGKTRFHSVKNALVHCPDNGIILVHDAVRPYVPEEVIKAVIHTASEKGTAIPVLPVNESLRKVTQYGSKAINRKDFVVVQTPQGFRSEIIKKAYTCRYKTSFTDDASVVESAGYRIYHVPGSTENIKITFPQDMKGGRKN